MTDDIPFWLGVGFVLGAWVMAWCVAIEDAQKETKELTRK